MSSGVLEYIHAVFNDPRAQNFSGFIKDECVRLGKDTRNEVALKLQM